MKPSDIVLGLACIVGAAMPAVAQRASTPPQGGPGTVTLSLEQYDRLLERAEHPVKRPEPPPIPAVLGRADLRVRVVGERARGTFTLEGEVFQSGTTKVPLVSSATLLDAHLGTTSVPLVTEGLDGGRTGRRAAAVHDRPGLGHARCRHRPGGRGAAAGADGRQRGALAGSARPAIRRADRARRDYADARRGRRHARGGDAGAGSRATVSWSSRESTAPTTPQEARTMAEIKTMVRVGEVRSA